MILEVGDEVLACLNLHSVRYAAARLDDSDNLAKDALVFRLSHHHTPQPPHCTRVLPFFRPWRPWHHTKRLPE